MRYQHLWTVLACCTALSLSAAISCAGDETLETPTVQAKALRSPPPEYPDEVQRRQIEGFVIVVATVDEAGAVVETEVTKSAHGELTRCALAAVKKWKFKPAEKDGQPIRARVTIPLKFELQK